MNQNEKLYSCPHCHGVGKAKYLRHHIQVCIYCNSTGVKETKDPESVPNWYTGEKTVRDNWVNYLNVQQDTQ